MNQILSWFFCAEENSLKTLLFKIVDNNWIIEHIKEWIVMVLVNLMVIYIISVEGSIISMGNMAIIFIVMV